MTVDTFHDTKQLRHDRAKYGNFGVVHHGMYWEIVGYRPHLNRWNFMGLPRFWREVNAARIAQALMLERQHARNELTPALAQCKERFDEYEAHHRAKRDHEKADRNKEMSELCRKALES